MYKLVILIIALILAGNNLVSCSTERTSASRSARYFVEGGVERGKVWHDNREYAKAVNIESLYNDGIHDPSNDDIKALQNPSDALGSFPYDRRGSVDWVKALNLGIIEPRADLTGKGKMNTLDMDILFKNTGKMPWVKFPHITHTRWLDCSNCHPKIFIPQKGANNISMDAILAGEFCGRCHDKVAFSLWICERCHSVPHGDSPKQWWGKHKNDRFSNIDQQQALDGN